MTTKRRGKRSSNDSTGDHVTDNNQCTPDSMESETNGKFSDLLYKMRTKEARLKALNQMWCTHLRTVGAMFTLMMFHKFMTKILELKEDLKWTPSDHPPLFDILVMVQGCFIDVLLSCCLVAYLSTMIGEGREIKLSIGSELLLGSSLLALLRLYIAINESDSTNNSVREALPGMIWYFISLNCLVYMQHSIKIANRNINLVINLQKEVKAK